MDRNRMTEMHATEAAIAGGVGGRTPPAAGVDHVTIEGCF